MPLFDADNRLRSDLCAINKRDSQNFMMEDYVFRDVRATHACPKDLSPSDCEDLERRIKNCDGFGVTSGVIDSDSDLRFPFYTHDRTRQSLNSRVFLAGPDMGRGGLDTSIESKLLLSGDSGTARVCAHRFAELSYDRFDPMITRVPVENIVKPFPAGEPSRSDESLQRRGYRCNSATVKIVGSEGKRI